MGNTEIFKLVIYEHQRLKVLARRKKLKINKGLIKKKFPDLEDMCKLALDILAEETIQHGCILKPIASRMDKYRYKKCFQCEELDDKKDKMFAVLGACVGCKLR